MTRLPVKPLQAPASFPSRALTREERFARLERQIVALDQFLDFASQVLQVKMHDTSPMAINAGTPTTVSLKEAYVHFIQSQRAHAEGDAEEAAVTDTDEENPVG